MNQKEWNRDQYKCALKDINIFTNKTAFAKCFFV